MMKRINELTKELKTLKSDVKKLENYYQHDICKIYKKKGKRTGNTQATGFVKSVELPKELAELIGVEIGTTMSMPKYTSEFYKEVLTKKNLFYKDDKRVFRVDDQVAKALNLTKDVNKSTDPKDPQGFNFCNLQKIFANVLNKNNLLNAANAASAASAASAVNITQPAQVVVVNAAKK